MSNSRSRCTRKFWHATAVAWLMVAAGLWATTAEARQPLQRQASLSGTSGTFFGFVAVDGATAAAGAPRATVSGSGLSRQGTVSVYTRSGATWAFAQRLVAADPLSDGNFGQSVAISGTTMAVGADLAEPSAAGAIYIFVFNGTSWVQQARLTAEAGTGILFGQQISLHGDTLIAGHEWATTNSLDRAGTVYVFQRSGTTWTRTRVSAPAPVASQNFGASIDISGTTFCVSSRYSPSTYVYVGSGSAWTLQQTLLGPTGGIAGCRLAGDTLVTAPDGAVHVFTRSASTWTEQPVVNSTPARALTFADVSGDTLVAGAPEGSLGGPGLPGSVFVFARSGGVWTQTQRIQEGNPVFNDAFGQIVVTDGTTLAVGVPTFSYGSLYGRVATGPPGAPTNLQASANGNALSMSWGAPASGAAPTSYTLIARATPGGTLLGTLPLGNVTSFSAAAPNGVFALSLTATNASGTGPESTSVTVTLPSVPPPPAAPTNLVATVLGSTATLTWSAPASGGPVGNYALVAGLTPGFAVPLGTLPLPAGATTTSIPGIPPGTYYLRVLAQNAGGTSAASNEVAITVAAPSAPGAPTLNAPTVSGNTVGLSWTPGGGGAPTSYVLTALTSGGVVLGSAPLSGSSASFPGVPSGSYLLRLVAVNSVGPSPASNTVTLVVP